MSDLKTSAFQTLSRPSRRTVGLGLAAAGLGALGLTGTPSPAGADYPPTEGEMQGFVLLKDRAPAPDTPFFDGRENVRHFTDFGDEVLLVNFWATWCAPCIREMPALDRLRQSLSDQPFRLVLISQDRQGAEIAEPFLRDRLNLPDLETFYDKRLKLGRALGVRGLPSTYLIDREGNLVGGLLGPAEWDSEDAEAMIRHVIDEG